MGKTRIYELAKELDKSSKEVVTKAQEMGMEVNNHMESVSDAEVTALKKAFKGKDSKEKSQAQGKPDNQKLANQNGVQQTGKKDKPFRGKSSLNNPKFLNRNKPKPQRQQGGQPRKPNENRSAQQQNHPARDQNRQKVQQEQKVKTQQQGAQAIKSQVQEPKKTEVQKPEAKKTQSTARTNTQGATHGSQQQNRNQKQQNRTNQNRQEHRPANQQSDQGKKQKEQNQNRGQGPKQNQGQNQNQNRNQNRNQNQSQNQSQNRNPNANRNKDFGKPAEASTDASRNRGGGGRKDNREHGKRDRFDNQNRDFGGNRNKFKKKKGKQQKQQTQKPPVPARKFRELPDVLEYTEGMNVAEIAKKIHREPAEIIKKLFMMGVMVNQNQPLDKDTIELLAVDYGIEPKAKVQIDIADIDKFFEPEEIKEENLVARPPVVTIMGHVDHGKTTLLDNLRHSRVTSGEAGGITQHIGAYQIEIGGKPITFLDTPGHAAFTSMRARGASITDITVLVVAADDGVMPQTIEAINHAKAADVPIIVAVNKIDKPGANPDHVMQELSEYELIPEAWGGDTIFVNISAKFGQNIDELLEMILLVAEVEDLKADPTQRAIGSVIEARLDKGKGPVATLLVQQGTLHIGDPIVVGNTYGRVRVMTNDLGRRVKTAEPATPVEITGLNDVPQAGDHFAVFDDEKTARAAGEERAKRALLEQRAISSRVTLDNLFESLKEGELKEVNVIIKADVQGSAEALSASLQKIEVEGVRVKIVHSAVGAINESDVTLAAASNAIIIGFNVRPTPQAKVQAETEEVDIRLHRIIYKAIEEIETAMKGMLDPEYEEKITGQMIIRELYKVSKVGTIAGSYVTEGVIHRDSGVRVIRDGIVIYEGKLASLKRYKDDVKEVKMGFECGAMIERFNDVKVDDVIEAFVMEEIKND